MAASRLGDWLQQDAIGDVLQAAFGVGACGESPNAWIVPATNEPKRETYYARWMSLERPLAMALSGVRRNDRDKHRMIPP